FKRDGGIHLLKDKQALRHLTETAEKAKMALSSLTQANIREIVDGHGGEETLANQHQSFYIAAGQLSRKNGESGGAKVVDHSEDLLATID
ncbi:hypothetical protein MKW98_009927, partial [Papaver atlanticum]